MPRKKKNNTYELEVGDTIYTLDSTHIPAETGLHVQRTCACGEEWHTFVKFNSYGTVTCFDCKTTCLITIEEEGIFSSENESEFEYTKVWCNMARVVSERPAAQGEIAQGEIAQGEKPDNTHELEIGDTIYTLDNTPVPSITDLHVHFTCVCGMEINTGAEFNSCGSVTCEEEEGCGTTYFITMDEEPVFSEENEYEVEYTKVECSVARVVSERPVAQKPEAGDHGAITDKKKEAASTTLEGKTLAELQALLKSGRFSCNMGRRYFVLSRYSEGRFEGSLHFAGEGSEEFSLSEDEFLKELHLWTYGG